VVAARQGSPATDCGRIVRRRYCCHLGLRRVSNRQRRLAYCRVRRHCNRGSPRTRYLGEVRSLASFFTSPGLTLLKGSLATAFGYQGPSRRCSKRPPPDAVIRMAPPEPNRRLDPTDVHLGLHLPVRFKKLRFPWTSPSSTARVCQADLTAQKTTSSWPPPPKISAKRPRSFRCKSKQCSPERQRTYEAREHLRQSSASQHSPLTLAARNTYFSSQQGPYVHAAGQQASIVSGSARLLASVATIAPSKRRYCAHLTWSQTLYGQICRTHGAP
jgi:hypothetical protein